MKRKFLSILLTLAMALTLLPVSAMAEGENYDCKGGPDCHHKVAKIDDSPFSNEEVAHFDTLTDAIRLGQMETPPTFKLLDDLTEDVVVPAHKDIYLDLNGHKLTNASGHTITVENGGELNISDSVGTGVVDNTSHGKAAIYNEGEVTLNGGTFERSAEVGTASPDSANGNSWYTVKNFGTMEINSGVTIKNKGSFSSTIANGWQNAATAGEGNEPAHSADAVLTINGGNISGGKITVKNDDCGKLTINNGTFTQSESNLYCVYNANVAEITGGTIKGYVGNIESNSSEYNKGEFTITGGTFNTDVSEFVADGYILNNGTVEKLGETNSVAKVGDTYYKTLAEAVAAAKDGGTIDLLSNVSERLWIKNNEDVTINLNGHTISSEKQTANVRHGKLTVNGPGTIKEDTPYFGALLIKGSTNQSDTDYAVATINKNVTLEGWAPVFIDQFDDQKNAGKAYGITVNLNGAVLNGKKDSTGDLGSGIYVNGNIKDATNAPVINLDSTTVTSEGQGMYLAGYATTTVNGGSVSGSETGIEIRAGKLTVNGATVTGNGIPTSVTPNGNGSTSVGAGIAVAQHTTKLPIEVTINSGAISGYTAFYESNPQNNAAGDLAKINIAVKGGEFKAINGGTNAVYSQNKTGFITGGTFTGETAEEYLDEGCKLENGKVVPADDSVAKIGNKGYKTLAGALNAVKDGETITLLKDTELKDAQYTIDKSVTINGSGKISCTVKSGEATRAFVVENNGSLTLDGVELDIQGTKNSDTKKNNDGTGIDVQYGGSLILKNQAVLKLHDLERGTVFSEPEGTTAKPGQVVINNSTFNSTDIDGNASNGGDWKVTNGSTVNIDNCGSYGLSVDSLTTEQSTVNVSGTGYSAIYGKNLQFKNGSNVLISGAGTKLPLQSQWSDARSPIQTDKNGGTIVVDSGAVVTVQNCENKEGKANNTIYLPKNTTYTNNGTVNATIITDTAPEGSCVVTLVSDGKTIGVQTVSKDFKFALPEAPAKNNYTFKGWSDGSATYKVGDEVVITKDTTFTALWSYNGSSSGGGSSSSSRRYDVSAPSVKHGDVTVSPKNASKGDTVTITVKPDSGYELDTLTVKDASGSKIKVKDKGDGKFTFTMPASKVTVSAEFAEIETLDFADVSTDAYYYEAVKWAAKKGITGGTGDGTFNPNGSCTRAHIVTFLWRAAGSPEPKSTVSFADVPAGSYYAKAVAWAVENGITLGTGDGTFSPNATCTRAQSVTFLYRALGTAPTTVNGFTDVTADAFYADAVAWAVESGVTNGTSASTFSPNNGCTRAQIVTFLYRTMK
jgi:uncharacterized repeat protein (TIGR02543 family)